MRSRSAAGILLLAALLGSCGTESVRTVVISDTPPEGAVSVQILAATVYWTDSRDSLAVHELEDAPGVSVLPLEEVRPPRRILAVDGLLPGEPGYPLLEWTLSLHPRSGRPYRNADSVSRPEAPEFFRVAAVGDIMPGRGFDSLLMAPGGRTEALGDVAALLSDPDLLIGNLETAVTGHSEAIPKSYNFRVPADTLRAVTDLGFDFYHLANNHGWDYGERGFLDTLEALNSLNAGYSGAGTDLEAARFAWETATPGGQRIRILSLGAYFTERNGFDGASTAAARPDKPGVLWDSPENEDFIREVLGRDDAFTIVTVHGGHEWQDHPGTDVRQRYRRYADWGADLVLAHHPHVLQGMEFYRGAFIAYSLGNFIFPGMKGWYTGEETGVLDFLLLEDRLVAVDFHPVRIDNIRLRRAEGEGIEERFREMSRELEASTGG